MIYRILQIALGLVIGVALCWFVFAQADMDKADWLALLSSLNWPWLAVVLLLTHALMVAGAVKWQLLSRVFADKKQAAPPFAFFMRHYLWQNWIGQFVPPSLAIVLGRAWAAREIPGVRLSHGLWNGILDQALELAFMLSLAGGSLLVLGFGGGWPSYAAGAVLGVAALSVFLLLASHLLLGSFPLQKSAKRLASNPVSFPRRRESSAAWTRGIKRPSWLSQQPNEKTHSETDSPCVIPETFSFAASVEKKMESGIQSLFHCRSLSRRLRVVFGAVCFWSLVRVLLTLARLIAGVAALGLFIGKLHIAILAPLVSVLALIPLTPGNLGIAEVGWQSGLVALGEGAVAATLYAAALRVVILIAQTLLLGLSWGWKKTHGTI